MPFAAEHLPSLIRFCERTLVRPRSEAFYRWRYLECPAQLGFLAFRDQECVAMVWAFVRSYHMGRDRRKCLETFEWFCLPEWRGSGLGIRVMQALMKQGDPAVAIGGTQDTLGLLPRLGWRKLGTARMWILHLGGAAVGRSLRRRFRIPAALGRGLFRGTARHWFSHGHRPGPRGHRFIPVSTIGPEILPLYAEEALPGTVSLPDPAFVRWLIAGFPGMGHFVPLYFAVDGKLCGWSLTRVYETPEGREAALVDVFAQPADPALYAWMVSESVACLQSFEPDRMFAITSSPMLESALQSNHFLYRGDELPIHAWCTDSQVPAQPLHLGLNASDLALMPYPETWEFLAAEE